MYERARTAYIRNAILAPVDIPATRFLRYREERPAAVVHIDIDGTCELYDTPELFSIIINLLRDHPPFAAQWPYIKEEIKEAYERHDLQEFRRKLSWRFARSEMKIDFFNGCVEKGVDIWTPNTDLRSFLREQLPSIHVRGTWDTGNFRYAAEKVNEKLDVENGIYYCTEVEYDEKTRMITRITPNTLQSKGAQIRRDVALTRIPIYKFMFIGDSPYEEPYSSKAVYIAFWLRENADMTSSKAKVNVKIPEAKAKGFSLLTPMIKRAIVANEELDIVEENDQLTAFDAAGKIKASHDPQKVAEQTQAYIRAKRLWTNSPDTAEQLSNLARMLQVSQSQNQEKQKSLTDEIRTICNGLFDFHFDQKGIEEFRQSLTK